MKKTLVVMALIIAMIPVLSACESGDVQQLIYYAKLWAIVHDVTNEEGQPTFGAGTRFVAGEALGVGTTGDEEGDAAIDAGRVVYKIKQAEDEAEKGRTALYAGDSVTVDVLPHYDQATKLRPGDWSYRNERGIAYLANPDIGDQESVKRARADFDQATALAKKSGRQEEYLRMLKQRQQTFERFVGEKNKRQAAVNNVVYQEESRLYDELYQLTKDNNYLLLKQQADTNAVRGQ
ncbi:MAG: hypothetical protein HYX80_06695 [Chloroflexi bacterium]|nr:hypothetical protein [Chloroflexota bacterium]